MKLEPTPESVLGLTNVNDNRNHSNQTHGFFLWPRDYIPFESNSRGRLYDPILLQGLLQHRLQKCFNIVVRIIN